MPLPATVGVLMFPSFLTDNIQHSARITAVMFPVAVHLQSMGGP